MKNESSTKRKLEKKQEYRKKKVEVEITIGLIS